ncbi:MAG: hypothetical protein H0X38_01680 [Planctomycetes bacterium]|nr:hypothetical protein [Planctomycetota bacterium]
MLQRALTVVVPVIPGRVAELTALLQAIGDRIDDNAHIPFAALTTTHFCRWVVIPATGPYPAQLAFESSYDGADDAAYVAHLLQVAGPGLRTIYAHCAGLSAAPADAELTAWLLARRVAYGAFHLAYPGRSVADIRNDTRLRAAAEDFLDGALAAGRIGAATPPAQARALVADHLHRQQPPLVLAPHAREPCAWGLAVRWTLLVLAALALAPLWVPVLLFKEWRDASATLGPVVAAPELRQREDHTVQNQLTHLVELKPGLFRRCVLRGVLAAIDGLAHLLFTRGRLGSISTIHFARWVFIDDGRRLLFFSNFDGSWENYLGDFVDKAALGLSAVWSNTVGFPRTWLLVLAGARDEERFKSWTRVHQLQTQVWFSNHPDETVDNILDNAALRDGLAGTGAAPDARAWLRRL